MTTKIMWFRRDLRVRDNEALAAAADDGPRVLPLFVLDPRLTEGRRTGAARLAYLRRALADLDESLRRRGGRLVVRRGDPREVVPALAGQIGADAVCFATDHSPYASDRDAAVGKALECDGIAACPYPGTAIREPGSVLTGAGRPYRVFTPFHEAWQQRAIGAPVDPPGRVHVPDVAGEPLADLGLPDTLPGVALPDGGEAAANARLERFLDEAVDDYGHARDRLALDTSRLSADLHFGCLSPREVYARLDRRHPGQKAFARQLVWRDFYLHVLSAWPEVATTEFNPAYRALPWRGESPAFHAWREGRTGYPVVDAGMRQLLREGWMHNRARMVVASFLCKDLLVDWRLGEAHFLRHLVDGDWASNNGGWQWAAGTGTDAQPYFRIFNPVTQGTTHDPEGRYVRRHVPELHAVPTRWIHRPWDMPEAVQRDCGVRIGEDYPLPIVDHAEARAAALDWFTRHRRSTA